MKKFFMIATIIFLFFFVSPGCVSFGFSYQEISADSQQFIGIGKEYEKDLQVSDIVNNAASILTTIGIVVVLGGLLILGIKYMTATPEEAAKLKHKLIGLVVAGIIIIGAFGIWKLAGNLISNSIGDVEPVKVSIIETTATPPPTPTPTPTQKPVQTPIQTPEQTPGQTPVQYPIQTPTQEDPLTRIETIYQVKTSTYEKADSLGKKAGLKFDTYIYTPQIENVETPTLPLIIYLHGLDDDGSNAQYDHLPRCLNLNDFSSAGNPKIQPPAVIVSPGDTTIVRDYNRLKEWIELIKEYCKEKNIIIDKERISLTGHSDGTYNAAIAIQNQIGKEHIFASAILLSMTNISTSTGPWDADIPVTFVFEQKWQDNQKQMEQNVKNYIRANCRQQ